MKMSMEKRDAIRERLGLIEAANGGRLTPADVVRDAQDADSPLHDLFEWDVGKAARAYWLDQARTIITSVVVVQRTESSSIASVYYVRDPSAAHDEQGYVSVTKLRGDSDMAREAIVQEFSRAADLLRRAKQIAAALEMESEVEALITGVVELRERVQKQATA